MISRLQITTVRVSSVECQWLPLVPQPSQFTLYDTSQPSDMYVIQHSLFNQQTERDEYKARQTCQLTTDLLVITQPKLEQQTMTNKTTH